MTNYNPCYDHGAIWKTRTKIYGQTAPDFNNRGYIPRGELVMLVYYSMNLNFEEEVILLWDNKLFYIENVDTGASFLLEPQV